MDRAIFPVGDHPKKFEGQTQAAASNDAYGSVATSNATWTLESKKDSAVYSGTYTLETTGRKYSNAYLGSELHFTLLESSSYSLAATFDAFLAPTGFSSTFMGASLRRLGEG